MQRAIASALSVVPAAARSHAARQVATVVAAPMRSVVSGRRPVQAGAGAGRRAAVAVRCAQGALQGSQLMLAIAQRSPQ